MKDIMLITHFIGLTMGVGTSFAFMFLGIARSKMGEEEANKFAIHTFTLARMGHIGLLLLFISGGYLMTPHWQMLSSMPLLMIKLVLFLFLAAILGMITSRVKKVKAGKMTIKKIEPLGKVALLTSITIVILAVLNFH